MKGNDIMKYSVQSIQTYRVAYFRRVGPYGPDNYKVMDRLKTWAVEKQLLNATSILLGISLDNPQQVSPMECRYDACIVIDEQVQLSIDDDVKERVIEGGKYFVYSIKHTPEAIQRAWNEIMPMIYQNGYVIDDKPILERYIGLMDEHSYCDICVPIR